MLSWLMNIFNARPAPRPIQPGDPVPPGLRVNVPDQGLEGTVSAFVSGPHGTRARVVFEGHQSTWIQNVSLHRIEL